MKRVFVKTNITKLLLSLLIIAFSSQTFAAPTCQDLFKSKTRTEKVISLFIKDAPENPAPTKLAGFATKIAAQKEKSWFFKSVDYAFDFIPNKLGHLLTLNRSYSFTPFKAIDEWVFDKPTHFVSQKTTGKKKELGILVKLPLLIMMSTAAWNAFDQKVFWPTAEREAAQQILRTTEQQASYLDKLIDTDFKFKQIKEQRNHDLKSVVPMVYNGKNLEQYIETPAVRARFLALGLRQEYQQYFEVYKEHTKESGILSLEQNEALFAGSKLFSHLDFFFEGVKPVKGSYVAPQHLGPLSDQQKQKLYNLTHLLYAKYVTIDVLLNTNAQALTQKSLLARDIYNDPYTKELYQLHRQNRITKEQLKYYMEEDAYHTYYMSIFETLHIVNFKYENGKYTQEALTLNDLRQSRLESLK